ncbi:hypothetical protein ACI782_02820 [Geodermatophilus sp. SYSU D00703]
MARLSDLTDQSAVVAAVAEFKRLGRPAFLAKYGFAESRVYFAWVDGEHIDSKALVAAIWAHQYPDRPRLTAADFSGGRDNTGAALERLGIPLKARWDLDWDIAVGEHLSRRQRMQLFGGATPSRIEPSASTLNVFLYSHPGRNESLGCNFDGWSADGSAFLFTGEGRRGDQLIRVGNLAVVSHKLEQRALRLFLADGLIPGTQAVNQLYIGEFQIDDADPFVIVDAPDEEGELRSVFVFRLGPVGPTLRRPQDVSQAGDPSSGVAELVDLEVDEASEFETPGAPPSTATKREALLVKRYRTVLARRGHPVRRWQLRPTGELTTMLTDLYDETAQELYEAKGSASRPSMRLALGQLLDYERHLPTPPKLKTVLVPTRPADDLLDLLHSHGVGCVWETGHGSFHRSDP